MKRPSDMYTSTFAIYLEFENPLSFFRFSFRATLFFHPYECPGFKKHRSGHLQGGK